MVDDATPSTKKRCCACPKEFPATKEFFFLHKQAKDGLQPRCKSCYMENRRVLAERKLQDVPETITCSACEKDWPATEEFFYKGTSGKYGFRSKCKVCYDIVGKQYEQENKDRIAERKKRYRERNRERLAQVNSQWHQQNRERRLQEQRERYQTNTAYYLEMKKRYVQANPEKVAEQRKAYREANREELRSKARLYAKAHRPKYNAAWHRRQARKRLIGGSHTAQQLAEQLKRQKSRCYYCKKPFSKYHIEHIVPISRDGSNDISNIVLACQTCNLKKGNKLPHEWAEGGHLL